MDSAEDYEELIGIDNKVADHKRKHKKKGNEVDKLAAVTSEDPKKERKRKRKETKGMFDNDPSFTIRH